MLTLPRIGCGGVFFHSADLPLVIAEEAVEATCPNVPVLPAVSQMVNPDCWLQRVDGQSFAREVQADGSAVSRWTSEYLGPHEHFGSDHSQTVWNRLWSVLNSNSGIAQSLTCPIQIDWK